MQHCRGGWDQGESSLLCNCRCRVSSMSELDRALNTASDYLWAVWKYHGKGIGKPWFEFRIFSHQIYFVKVTGLCVKLCMVQKALKWSKFSVLPPNIPSYWLWPWDHAGKSEECELSIPSGKQLGVSGCWGISDVQLAMCKYSKIQETETSLVQAHWIRDT